MMLDIDGENYSLKYDYDFGNMEELPPGFSTRNYWPRYHRTGKSQQYYRADTSDHSPFSLSDDGLTITAFKTPEEIFDESRVMTNWGRETMPYAPTAEQMLLTGVSFVQPVISGMISSRDLSESVSVGYWEIRCKLPPTKGMHPAFWLLPDIDQSNGWPEKYKIRLPEIDVLETDGDATKGSYHTTSHVQDGDMHLKNPETKIETGLNLTDYHQYGVLVSDKDITWFFDRRPVNSWVMPSSMHGLSWHFIVSMSVGGWGGDARMEDLPSKFEVDYVKVYEKQSSYDKNLDGLIGDQIFRLDDGRIFTKRDLNLYTEYLIQSSRRL